MLALLFLLSLIVGFLGGYRLRKGTARMKMLLPTPANAGKIVYQDDNGVRYRYRMVAVDA